MPVPDVYAKGQGHRPTMSVAGHFLGMHAPERPDVWKPEQLWYRGDDYAEAIRQRDPFNLDLVARMDRLRELEERNRLLKGQVTDIVARCTDLEAQLAAATARRPPKRATKP
jgi:hypothetical protein